MTTSRKLYRLPEQGKLFGVAAGLADYFDIDVTLLRIIIVIMVVAGAGFVIPVYLALALLLPTPGKKGLEAATVAETVKTNFDSITHNLREGESGRRASNIFGVGLIILGVWLIAIRIMPSILMWRWDLVWPVTLVLLGLLMLTRIGRRS